MSNTGNSTFQEIVDKVLVGCGQLSTSNSSGTFSLGDMDKPQEQAKWCVNMCNQELAMQTKGRYTRRVFLITTSAWDGPFSTTGFDNNFYQISSLTSFERLVKDSWRVITTGQGQELTNKSYDDWTLCYPTGELQSGVPLYWVDLMPSNDGADLLITGATAANPCVITVNNTFSRGDYLKITSIVGNMGTTVLNGHDWRVISATSTTATIAANTAGKTYTSGGLISASAVDRVAFSGPCNQALTIQYEGYLNTVELTGATDRVIWPKEFESVLIRASCGMLESLLSEGRSGTWQSKLDEAIGQMRQNSRGPVDYPPGLDIGITIPGRRRGLASFIWNNS